MNKITYKHLTTKEEADQCYKISSMKEISPWLGGAIIPPRLIESAKKKGVIVAKEGDKVVGFILFNHRKTDNVSVIYDYCVHPEYRGKRIGSTLCRKIPPPRMAKCIVDNEPTKRLFESIGMQLWKKEHYVKKSGTEVNVLVYKSE